MSTEGLSPIEEEMDLDEDLIALGFDLNELNDLDFDLFGKFKGGELKMNDVMAHQEILKNISPSPSQMKLFDYVSKNFKS